MMRYAMGLSAVIIGGLVLTGAAARAAERTSVGVDVGVVIPTEALRDSCDPGAVVSPYAAYMFNDYLGLMGQFHALGAPIKDRPGVEDDTTTWAIGGTMGPRLVLPIDRGQLYATWQGGMFSGIGSSTPIHDTSFGWSVGGGLNTQINRSFSTGAWVRFNQWEQNVYSDDTVKFVSVGLGIRYAFPPRSDREDEEALRMKGLREAEEAEAMRIKGLQEAEEAEAMRIKALQEAEEEAMRIKALQEAEGKKIVLRGVYFDYNQSAIPPDEQVLIDQVADTLLAEPTMRLVVEGHTDSRGTDAYNRTLSERRAQAVCDYLESRGIDASRLEPVGFGESKPVASNDTEDGRAQNRRVELRVTNE